jgi:hypothetical protein
MKPTNLNNNLKDIFSVNHKNEIFYQKYFWLYITSLIGITIFCHWFYSLNVADRKIKTFIKIHVEPRFDVQYGNVMTLPFSDSISLSWIRLQEKGREADFFIANNIKISKNLMKITSPHLEKNVTIDAEFFNLNINNYAEWFNDDPILFATMTMPVLGSFSYAHDYDKKTGIYEVKSKVDINPSRVFTLKAKTKGIDAAARSLVTSDNFAYNTIMWHLTQIKPKECSLNINHLDLKKQGILPSSFSIQCLPN